ncbi:MAG: helix-turn-helix domain-containing protein [Actinomycetota bacterium]|nr:helix-turn-helix domain-containing protein [Actinomycetota bacterium]
MRLSQADVDAIARRLDELAAPPNERPFYTVAKLASRLSLSERTVKDLLARGTIPSYRVAGSRRVDPADVDAYLAANRSERRAA